MWVRGIARTAGLSRRTRCWKARTGSSDSIVRTQATSAGSVTPKRPVRRRQLAAAGGTRQRGAGPCGLVDQELGHGDDVDRVLAVLGHHGVEVDQVGDPVRDGLATEAMTSPA